MLSIQALCPTYLCLKGWRQLICVQDIQLDNELPTLLLVLCSVLPLLYNTIERSESNGFMKYLCPRDEGAGKWSQV